MIDYEKLKTEAQTNYEPVEIEQNFNLHFRYYIWYQLKDPNDPSLRALENLSYPVLCNLDYCTDFISGGRDVLTEFIIEI